MNGGEGVTPFEKERASGHTRRIRIHVNYIIVVLSFKQLTPLFYDALNNEKNNLRPSSLTLSA